MDVDAWVERHLKALAQVATPRGATVADGGTGAAKLRVTLDQVGESIGIEAVTAPQIDELITALEAAGILVESELGPGVQPLLHRVLLAARQLKSQGASVAPERVAEASGLSVREVRVALLYAEVLYR